MLRRRKIVIEELQRRCQERELRTLFERIVEGLWKPRRGLLQLIANLTSEKNREIVNRAIDIE
jgi:hypothetical protein